MDLQDQKTGIFGMTHIFDVSHEIDGDAMRDHEEAQVCHRMTQELMEILKDGRRYEVMMVVSTFSGDTYPPAAPTYGSPTLPRPSGYPNSFTQYTTNCRLIVVLANPLDAEIGEYVRLSAFHYAEKHNYCHTVFRPDGDREFKRSTVGWKRTS